MSTLKASPFQTKKQEGVWILCDTAFCSLIGPEWFDLDAWVRQGLLKGSAPGRGSSAFLQTPAGDAVLRHYRRGGLPGRLIQDRYLWTGLKHTRPWQEMAVTRQLFDLGLPVPRPLAACVKRQGLTYRADLLTQRLAALPLSDYLPTASLGAQKEALRVTALTLRRFHQAGLNHVDLNPRNLLIAPKGQQVWLIDFDRCRLGAPEPTQARLNLLRLYRGLKKLDSEQAERWFDWLLSAY